MSRIKEHIFASIENTPIFANINSEIIIAYVPLGTWMGIVEKHQNWFKVISSNFDGWIHVSSESNNHPSVRDIKINQNKARIQYIIPFQEQLAG